MALNYVTLTGQVPGGAGATATFTPSVWLTDATDNLLIAPAQKAVTLDGNGKFSVSLLATDNGAPLPSGWTWAVAITGIRSVASLGFSFFLPFSGGATQDISHLAPVQPAPAVLAYLPLPSGTPASGQVPIATGSGEASAWGILPHQIDCLNVINDFGAKADIRDLTAAAITSGQNTLTCAGGSFTSADVGKVMYVYGAGASAGPLVTTVSSVTNSTTVVLAANASTTVASGNAFVGTDDTAAWQAALAAVQANGQTVYLPWGRSYVSGTLSAGVSGTIIRGGGSGSQIRYSGTVVSPCIKATSASTRVCIFDIRISQVDAVSAGTTIDVSNFASGSIERVVIDNGGGSGAPPAIGIDHNGTNCHYNAVRDCRVSYGGVGGMGIAVRGTSHSNTIDNCRMIPGAGADSTSSGIYITNAHSTTLIHSDTENAPGNGVFLDTAAHATTIVNPYLEANRINVQITSGVQTPVILGGTIESGSVANIQDNGSINSIVLNAWPNSGTTVSAAGIVTSVAAADTSVVVGGTGAAPTIRTATLDVIATQHPPAAAVGLNSQKITSLANGSAASDGAAFGQIPVVDSTATDIKALATALAAGAIGKWADAGHAHTLPFGRMPDDISLIAWNFDPTYCSNSSTWVNGTFYMARLAIRTARTITNLAVYLDTAATTATANQNFLALIDSTGTVQGQTAAGAIDTQTQSSGWLSHAMASTYAAPAGYYWVAALLNATTPGKFARGSGSSLTGPNGGLSGANMSFCVNGTGLTSVPGSVVTGSNTSAGAFTICVGVS